jgi:hypothetical protein
MEVWLHGEDIILKSQILGCLGNACSCREATIALCSLLTEGMVVA